MYKCSHKRSIMEKRNISNFLFCKNCRNLKLIVKKVSSNKKKSSSNFLNNFTSKFSVSSFIFINVKLNVLLLVSLFDYFIFICYYWSKTWFDSVKEKIDCWLQIYFTSNLNFDSLMYKRFSSNYELIRHQ